jgi:hypothetical protein
LVQFLRDDIEERKIWKTEYCNDISLDFPNDLTPFVVFKLSYDLLANPRPASMAQSEKWGESGLCLFFVFFVVA